MPAFDEVASVLELSPRQKSLVARRARAKQFMPVGVFNGTSGDESFHEPLDRRAAAEDKVASEEEWFIALRRMERLDTRERAILSLHHGLDGEVLTFKEIGRRYGVTSEWASNIQSRASRKLRHDRSDRADHPKFGSQ